VASCQSPEENDDKPTARAQLSIDFWQLTAGNWELTTGTWELLLWIP